jgi:septum formation protein
MKKIILASASPRRRELLAQIGLQFSIEASDYDEAIEPGLEPHSLAERLSRGKAENVAAKHRDAIVIAADTFGICRGKFLGKPENEAAARRMLRLLSGKTHTVVTGFTIIDTASHRVLSRSVETRVHIKTLTDTEIEAYIATGEPMDKAAAYAIQGLGAVIVDRIDGDYFNVIGLPLAALSEALKEFGIDIFPGAGSFVG